jgi:hypothetical protein
MTSAGQNRQYYWLTTTDFDAVELLRLCPEIVVGKFIVTTAFDSGPLRIPLGIDGWHSEGGLAYSPQIISPNDVPLGRYDEFYVFDTLSNSLRGKSQRSVDVLSHSSEENVVDIFVNISVFNLNDSSVVRR